MNVEENRQIFRMNKLVQGLLAYIHGRVSKNSSKIEIFGEI